MLFMQDLVREASITARQGGEKGIRAGHVRKVREVSLAVFDCKWESRLIRDMVAMLEEVQGLSWGEMGRGMGFVYFMRWDEVTMDWEEITRRRA